MAQSESEKALNAIQVSEKGLENRTWPYLKNAIDARKRRVRNSRILRDYLAALNKDAEVTRMAAVWALSEGRIRGIIEEMNVPGAVVPEMASEVEALRQIKRSEILTDGQTLRDELQAQINYWEEQRALDEKWADVEIVDTEGGKNEGTKTKRLPINQAIKELKEQLVLSHKKEADALEMYIPRPKQEFEHNINTLTDEEIAKRLEEMGYQKGIEKQGQIEAGEPTSEST